MTRVLIIDDHPIVLQGCRRILEDAGFSQISQAQSLTDGFRHYRAKKPDLIIVDLALRTGALHGLSFIRRLRLHDVQTPVLVFTMHRDPVIVCRALADGATGYLIKDTSPEDMLQALQKVLKGMPYISYELAQEVAFTQARERMNPLRKLTLRQLQTLALIAEGKPYGVIAEQLSLSYQTIANTVIQLKTLLGANSLAELMRLAIEHLPSIVQARTPARKDGRRAAELGD